MTHKTAKVSIICIIAIFIVSCCGIVMAHRAGQNRRGEFMKNRHFQHSAQMFDRKGGERGGDVINKPFNRPDSARSNPGDPRGQVGDRPIIKGPMGHSQMGDHRMGPGFMGHGRMGPMNHNPNLTREEICRNCPICNRATMGPNRPEFFGEKREGLNGPEFNKPELKIEENKEVEK
jgi:hypothetical protein